MLSKRTIIGLIVGSIIIGIGIMSLTQHIGTITINENYTVEVGGSTLYVIPAPIDTPQSMKIIGDTFDLKLESPGDGLQIEKTSFKEEKILEWNHLEDGDSKIHIQNTGSEDLTVTGTLIRSADPIWFTYDFMVIISGIVIIGFSMGFTLRKPKGF